MKTTIEGTITERPQGPELVKTNATGSASPLVQVVRGLTGMRKVLQGITEATDLETCHDLAIDGLNALDELEGELDEGVEIEESEVEP